MPDMANILGVPQTTNPAAALCLGTVPTPAHLAVFFVAIAGADCPLFGNVCVWGHRECRPQPTQQLFGNPTPAHPAVFFVAISFLVAIAGVDCPLLFWTLASADPRPPLKNPKANLHTDRGCRLRQHTLKKSKDEFKYK